MSRKRCVMRIGSVMAVVVVAMGSVAGATAQTNTIATWDFAWSPDGKAVAVAQSEGIALYGTTTGQEELALQVLTRQAARSVDFSPDGSQLVAVVCLEGDNIYNCNGEVRLWNLDTGRRKQLFESPRNGQTGRPIPLRDVQFSPNDSIIAVSYGIEIRVIDIETGNVASFQNKALSTFTFHPDGNQIYAGSGSHGYEHPSWYGLRLWNSDDGTLAIENITHSVVKDVAFSPDGRLLFVDYLDGLNIGVWDIDTNEITYMMPEELEQSDYLNPYVFSPDGRYLVGATSITFDLMNRELQIWDTETGQRVFHSTEYLTQIPTVLALSPDNSKLAIGGNSDGLIEVQAVNLDGEAG